MKMVLVENEIVSLENVQCVHRNSSGESISITYFGNKGIQFINFSGKDKKENSQKVFEEIFNILSK